MIVYLITIFLVVSLSYGISKLEEKKYNKYLLYFLKFLLILIPSVVSGIRYGIGTDYFYTYEPYFDDVKNGIFVNRGKTIEIGYRLINQIVIFFNGNVNIVLFICSLLTNFLIVKTIWYYKDKINVTMACAIFMFMYYQLSYNLVRQMLAAACILYGFRYLNKFDNKRRYKRNPLNGIIKYYVFVALGCTFHITALVGIVIPIIQLVIGNPPKTKRVISIIILMLVFVVACGQISKIMYSIPLLKYYAHYFKYPSKINFSIMYFIRILPIIIPFVFFKENIKKDREIYCIFLLNILGCIISLLTYFTELYGERLALYFSIFQLTLIPFYIEQCKLKKKMILVLIILIYSCFYSFIWYFDFIYKKRNETYPYKTIFSQEAIEFKNNKNIMKYDKYKGKYVYPKVVEGEQKK